MSQWHHTSALLAFLHNSAPNRRGAAKTPRQFHPLLQEKKPTREESTRTLNELFGVRMRSTPSK